MGLKLNHNLFRNYSGHHKNHHTENGDGRHYQKQHVTPDIARLHATKPIAYPVNDSGRQVDQTVNDSQVKFAEKRCTAGNCALASAGSSSRK